MVNGTWKGKIEWSLSHFSGLAIVRRLFHWLFRIQSTSNEAAYRNVREEEAVEQYCAQIYTRKNGNEWRVDFVVTKNLDIYLTVSECQILQVLCMLYKWQTFIQVVKKKYFSQGQPQFSFTFGFQKDFISLNIPKEGLQLNGWKICPFYKPKVCVWVGVVLCLHQTMIE